MAALITVVQAGNPISKLTASSLEDIKYIIDPAAVSEPTVDLNRRR